MNDWNQIVRENAAQVLNAALRITGNLADAEDISQEVFSEAYQKWNEGPGHRWAGVLRRMAVCRAIDLLRRRKPIERLQNDVVSLSYEPEANAVSRELEQRLRLAIRELPPRESEVFCLVFFAHQSHTEIAQQLEISKSAVAKALSCARSKLEAAFRPTWTGENQ